MSKQNLCNSVQIILAGLVSVTLVVIFLKPSWLGLEYKDFLDINLSENRMAWTLITAIISSPIAFAVWRLRDKNISEQIENSRKDTNLKEFQKLAEWVSGAHFVEEKVSVKTKYEETENLAKKIIEETREYTTPSNELAIQTYGKIDGSVALQIAAVYNLLPFYRGDYGESFKKPALNLLTSAWLALQRKELAQLEKTSEYGDFRVITKIQQNAQGPLGVAITRVLLSSNNQVHLTLLEHKEIFTKLCLAGMDFNISGIDNSCLHLFKDSNCFGINMAASNLSGADFRNANFEFAFLIGTILVDSILNETNFKRANLLNANLKNSYLINADLSWSKLKRANLAYATLDNADLRGANLEGADLREANLKGANLKGANLKGAYLTGADLTDANLTEADLIGADIKAYNLIKANWKGARLDGFLRSELEEYIRKSNM